MDAINYESFSNPAVNIKENFTNFVIEMAVPGLKKENIAIEIEKDVLTVSSKVTSSEEKTEEKSRTFLKLHPAIAPVKAAILPVTKKDGLPEKGKEIVEMLKYDFNIIYEDAASIGKRYARQDLIGTPFCIAVIIKAVFLKNCL